MMLRPRVRHPPPPKLMSCTGWSQLALGLKARPKALLHTGINLGLPGGEDTVPQRAFGSDRSEWLPQASCSPSPGRQVPADMRDTNRQQKIKSQKSVFSQLLCLTSAGTADKKPFAAQHLPVQAWKEAQQPCPPLSPAQGCSWEEKSLGSCRFMAMWETVTLPV